MCGNEREVVMQLWSLPATERLTGLTQQFRRGHRAAILVIRPGETETLERMMGDLTNESRKNLLVVIFGTGPDSVEESIRIAELVGATREVAIMETVAEVTTTLAQSITKPGEETTELPCVILLDENSCTPIEPVPMAMPIINSPEEIAFIREQAELLGVGCTSSGCSIQMDEGEIEVSFETGKVRFTSIACDLCAKECHKTTNICIVKTANGWASEEMGQGALLTLAKIYSLMERELPQHVENQLQKAAYCSKLEVPLGLLQDEQIIAKLRSMGYMKLDTKLSILADAERKAETGYISRAVFNTLKGRLTRVES
ncbi:MAG: hypothetical protein ACFFAY_10495 [Promethearchaeota archaeon]